MSTIVDNVSLRTNRVDMKTSSGFDTGEAFELKANQRPDTAH
jgi:hypothetical protein